LDSHFFSFYTFWQLPLRLVIDKVDTPGYLLVDVHDLDNVGKFEDLKRLGFDTGMSSIDDFPSAELGIEQPEVAQLVISTVKVQKS
jgi:hypothetical protein